MVKNDLSVALGSSAPPVLLSASSQEEYPIKACLKQSFQVHQSRLLYKPPVNKKTWDLLEFGVMPLTSHEKKLVWNPPDHAEI